MDRDRGIRIELIIDTDALYALMAYLREHEVALDRVSTVELDLEEVFVALTHVIVPIARPVRT